jgi:hypothetical protein
VTALLCVSPYCGLPGIHQADPADGHDDGCRGCQPARAADGLYLCDYCVRRMERDAWTAARLHAALGQALAGGNGRHGPGGGSIGLEPDAVAMESRTAIRATLVTLCRLVADERGHALPGDTVIAMAGYVCRNARWLAAHQAADEHASDLRDLVTDGRSWSVAYPVSGDRTLIGVCNQARTAPSGDPGAADEAPCGTALWHREGQPDLTCPSCGTTRTVQWWRWEMCSAGEREGIVDAYAGAAYLSWRWNRLVDPGLVRKWGQRHRLTLRSLVRDGETMVDGPLLRDQLGRVLFVLGELEAHAVKVWGEPVDALAKVGS